MSKTTPVRWWRDDRQRYVVGRPPTPTYPSPDHWEPEFAAEWGRIVAGDWLVPVEFEAIPPDPTPIEMRFPRVVEHRREWWLTDGESGVKWPVEGDGPRCAEYPPDATYKTIALFCPRCRHWHCWRRYLSWEKWLGITLNAAEHPAELDDDHR